MNEKHTPEPWRIEQQDGWFEIKGADDTKAADDGSSNEEYTPVMSPENARRIIACVNACVGIPLSLLERPGYSIKAELDSLDEQIRLRMAAENILDNYRMEVEKHLKTIREVLDKTGGI